MDIESRERRSAHEAIKITTVCDPKNCNLKEK